MFSKILAGENLGNDMVTLNLVDIGGMYEYDRFEGFA